MLLLRRSVARLMQLAVDVGLLAAAYIAAFLVRFEGAIPRTLWRTLAVSLPLVVVLQMGVLRQRGVHRLVWRYISLPDARKILAAVATATLVLLCVRAVIGSSWYEHHLASSPLELLNNFSSPIGVLLADAVFASTALLGVRALWRALSEQDEARRRSPERRRDAVPTILVGAGRAGSLVAREIQNRPDLGLDAVAFVDDDTEKQGTYIAGLPVLGRTDELERIATETGALQVLISMASAPGKDIRRVVRLCEAARLRVKIVPGLFELIGGAKAVAIRDVSVEDLLRREPIELDSTALGDSIRDQVILVTGAGGSIGSEICRQVAGYTPRQIVLLEQAENNLFFVERELRERFPHLSIVPCIADVCDEGRVDNVFSTFRPAAVFHAAAHKHVSMMEANPGEAVKNNVFGTITVANAADRHGVGAFVLISTDKAVNPASVMGATKRAAETYVQSLSSRSKTRFVAVRFGNVLGSTGSVVPIFRDQIAKGGPVTVTHPDMKRYFMTIPEATQLVLQAGAIGRSGEILILDMGEPVRMVDLAHDLITLSGLRPGVDIEVVFTGMRPGEKLFEELSTAEEAAERTRHPRIFVGRIAPSEWRDVLARVSRLRAVVDRAADGDDVRRALSEMVPEYTAANDRRGAEAKGSESLRAPVPLQAG